MGRKGFALVAALGIAVATLMLALSLAFMAQGALETGRNLRAKAQAKAQAEGGIAHGAAYLKTAQPSAAVELSGPNGLYNVVITPQGSGNYEVVSAATVGGSTHRAKALVQATQEVRSAFREGWFTGGRVTVNGQLDLYGARLHGDGGYNLNANRINICLPNQSGQAQCRPLGQVDEATRKALISGSIFATTCSPANSLICQGTRPISQVCPVWGNPPPANDQRYNTPCWDSLAGRTATVGTATRIPAPNLQSLWQEHLGLTLADDPYTRLRPASCQSVSNLSQLLSLLSGRDASSPRISICLTGNLTLGTPLTLVNVDLYVGGTVNMNSGSSLTLQNARLVSSGNMALGPVNAQQGELISSGTINFNSAGSFTGSKVYGKAGLNFSAEPSFVNTKVFSGASVNFNGNNKPLFEGNTVLAVNGSVTFNGSLKSSQNATPLLVASGDVTFNGSYQNAQSASFIWTLGKVTLNGNTTYRGGIASGGGVDTSSSSDGIVVNGGLPLFTTGLNNDLLPTYTVTRVQVVWRR
ncbi:MAG: hypothetical protein RMI36_10625 [Thermus sp.]|uniref:hypothetical protein n=1 Tax=Thermus sp. TaxID=275 RepID=UPI00298EEE44|nr:hypothetical protein [Thermus sp.]MDW8018265.1 hypothetical protein [Thermus sp.]